MIFENQLQKLYERKLAKMKLEEADLWLRFTRDNINRVASLGDPPNEATFEADKLFLLQREYDLDAEDDKQREYAKEGIHVQFMHGKIFRVCLDFTPEEWISILDNNGDYAVSSSSIFKTLTDALQNSGWIYARDLCEITHELECDDDGPADDPESPLHRIAQLWHRIQKEAEPAEKPFAYDPNNLRDAITILREGLDTWASLKLFDEPDGLDEKFIRQADSQMTIIRLLPALRTLYHQIHQLEIPEFRGFGILGENDTLAYCYGGPAVFLTREKAEKVKNDWNIEIENTPIEDPEPDETVEETRRREARNVRRKPYTVKRISITFENGMVVDNSNQSDQEWMVQKPASFLLQYQEKVKRPSHSNPASRVKTKTITAAREHDGVD